MDATLALIVEETRTRYGAHTVLLYGSRADGTDMPDSDYDVAAFAPVRDEVRDNAEKGRDGRWDLFIYPDTLLQAPSSDHLKLRNSRIIVDDYSFAAPFLARLDVIHLDGPGSISQEELAVRYNWSLKMLARIRRDDIEGNYRRVWLLMELLEDYFAIRGIWYQGPKRSFAWLKEYRMDDFLRFDSALRSNASLEQISMLIDCVFCESTAVLESDGDAKAT